MQVRRRHKLLVLAVVVVCLLVAVVAIKRVRASAPGGLAEANQHVPFAAVAPVKRETIATSLSIAGQFIPYQNIEVHAKVAGYIRKIYVDIGDHVHQGQVLAVLEVPELVAQLQGAGAGVRHAEEEILRSQNEVSRDEAQHVALHANAAAAGHTDKARPGLIAQQELDDAQSPKTGPRRRRSTRPNRRWRRPSSSWRWPRPTNSTISAMTDYARITAPFDGVVTWRYADTGALVQAGTSNTNAAAGGEAGAGQRSAPAHSGSRVAGCRGCAIGQLRRCDVQATGEHFTGKVTRFTDSLDRSTRTMQVEIDVPNDKYKLQPGMYADVSPAGAEPS